MRSLYTFLIIICAFQLCRAQDVRFIMPLKGTPGKDFFINYYVDHDSTDGFYNVFCNKQTYNGHRGTDLILRNFKTMDSGVFIYAAADGRVFEVDDGHYDRSKIWVRGGLGNHVAIIHKNRVCTYYGHMMKHSLLVKMGDSVKTGQPIGKVGSSGYSSYPHLHFEVRDQHNVSIDPFSGNCSPGSPSLWVQQPLPDTAIYSADDGFIRFRPNQDTLKEGLDVTYNFINNEDSVVCYWVLMHGMHQGDKSRIEWYSPQHLLWFKMDHIWSTDWHWGYTWFYLNMPLRKGEWLAKYYVNDKFIISRSFRVVN